MDAVTRGRAVAAATGHELNDELTIIFSSVDEALGMLEASDPVRAPLIEIRASAQRCAFKASGLLNFATRNGLRPSRVTLEWLTDHEEL
jgi:C4-dicarboxylate-specific signal transduction histidine kinase